MAAAHFQLVALYFISVLLKSGSMDYIDKSYNYVYSNLFDVPNPDAYLSTVSELINGFFF